MPFYSIQFADTEGQYDMIDPRCIFWFYDFNADNTITGFSATKTPTRRKYSSKKYLRHK